MKRIINVLFVAVVLSLVPVTNVCAQTVDNLRPPTKPVKPTTPPKKKPQNRTQKWEVKSVADLKSKLVGDHDIYIKHDKTNQTVLGGCAVQNDLSVYGSHDAEDIYFEFSGNFTIDSVNQISFEGGLVIWICSYGEDEAFSKQVYLQFHADGKGKYITTVGLGNKGKATIELVLK